MAKKTPKPEDLQQNQAPQAEVAPAEKPKKTLAEACNEFIGTIDRLANTRKRKCPGDLMALRRDLENFLNINHGILKEPVE